MKIQNKYYEVQDIGTKFLYGLHSPAKYNIIIKMKM